MKLSHAGWGNPRWTGHGREVLQNVVHWEGNGKPFSILALKPHEQYEKAKDKILKGGLSRSVDAQYASGDRCRNNSRKNDGMAPKQK